MSNGNQTLTNVTMTFPTTFPTMFFTTEHPVNYKPKRVVFVEGLLAKVYFDDDSVFVVNCLPEDEKFFSKKSQPHWLFKRKFSTIPSQIEVLGNILIRLR